MRVKKIAAILVVIIGILMIGQWSFFILMGMVPEFEDEPIRILFHLIAEFLTAIALIMGGLGLSLNKKWGFSVYLVALGMLSYTIVVSPGYYAQKGEILFVGMFAVLWVVAAMLIILGLRKESEFRNTEQEEN